MDLVEIQDIFISCYFIMGNTQSEPKPNTIDDQSGEECSDSETQCDICQTQTLEDKPHNIFDDFGNTYNMCEWCYLQYRHAFDVKIKQE